MRFRGDYCGSDAEPLSPSNSTTRSLIICPVVNVEIQGGGVGKCRPVDQDQIGALAQQLIFMIPGGAKRFFVEDNR